MISVSLGVAAGVLAGLLAAGLVRRPDWCIALWVVVEMTNASSVLADDLGFSVATPALALAVVATVWGLLGRGGSHVSPDRLPGSMATAATIVALVVVYCAVAVLALLASGWTDQAVDIAPEVVKNLLFVAVLVGGTRLFPPRHLARAVVVPLAVLGGFTLVDYFVLGGTQPLLGFGVVSEALGEGAATPRYAGPAEDPNIWGRVLLLGAPLAASLALGAHDTRRRGALAGWLVALVGLLGGIYLTQSRGALLGLTVAGIVWWILVGPKPPSLRRAVPVLAVALLAVPGVGSRLLSLDQLFGGTQVTDYALVERAAAQRVAFEMFRDHPFLGVGNPTARFDDYVQYVDLVFQRQVDPHNLYLQLAATGGVLLLLAWVCLVGAAVVAGLRVVAATATAQGDVRPPERVLAAAAVASLTGWSVTSIFLHVGFLRTVLAVICLCATLSLQTATRPLRVGEQVVAVPPGLAVAMIRTGVLAVVLGLGAGIAQSVATTRTYQATVTLLVLPDPTGGAATADGYQYDVVTRDTVIPTYAAIVAAVGRDSDPLPGTTVTATGVAEEAVVLVSATSPDADAAVRAVEQVALEGSEFINSQASLRQLATAAPEPVAVVRTRSTDGRWLRVGLGLTLVVSLVAAGGPWWRRLAAPVDRGHAPTSR